VFKTIGARAKLREAQLFGGIDAAELEQLDRLVEKLLAALSESESEQA
jgi:hypothetical protein